MIFKHALPQRRDPDRDGVGLQAGYMLGGAIVVEKVFALPGVGRLVARLRARSATTPWCRRRCSWSALMFVLTNLVADLLYAVLNPKLRTAAPVMATAAELPRARPATLPRSRLAAA